MDTFADLVNEGEFTAATALNLPGNPPRSYTYRRFRTAVQKTGNFLRHLGVRQGSVVGVADEPAAEPVLAFFGAALLGARTQFDPPTEADARTVVVPNKQVDAYSLPPGSRRVAYGGAPDDPTVEHFERNVSSENPTFPPTSRDGDISVLETGDRTYSQRELLDAGERVAEQEVIDRGDAVAVRAPLASPETVVAGLIAPLSVGATVLFPDEESVGDVAVATGDAPEKRTVRPNDVSLS